MKSLLDLVKRLRIFGLSRHEAELGIWLEVHPRKTRYMIATHLGCVDYLKKKLTATPKGYRTMKSVYL